MQKNNRFKDPEINGQTLEYISKAAIKARGDILTMTTLSASGHPGGSMSSIDIYLMLYYFLNITPQNVDSEERDRVVVSHGHTSPGVYSALGEFGFFDIDEAVAYFRKAGSPYEGHIERHIPGVEWSTGNLGQGLSAGCGFALASKIKGLNNYTFVAMGDGEQQKGQLSEARRFAVKHGLTNLFAVVDLNGLQISGSTEEVMHQNIKENYISDGWKVYETDGHDIAGLYKTFKTAIEKSGPAVILARTVMGKGVSFMENIKDYHGKTLTAEQYVGALKELGCENRYDHYKSKREAKIFDNVHIRPNSHFPSLKMSDSKVYPSDKKIDNRSAFGDALVDLAKANTGGKFLPFAVFDCDLAGSVKVDGFAKQFPENFFQSGIQEHNTATVAGAVSTDGILSVFADFGVFGIDEVYNQQRLNDINGANIKVVCTHVGVDVGEDGKTHQCIDYIGLLRNLFGFKIVLPADGNQTFNAAQKCFCEAGNHFIAMGRSVTPIITKENGTPYFDENYRFEYGKADIIRDGKDIAILSYGVMLYRALKIRDLLGKQNIDAMVINVSAPKEIDVDVLKKAAKTGKIVVYEDHNVFSGLGSIITDHLCEKGSTASVLKLGVEQYSFSGKPEDVFDMAGLSPEKAAERIVKFIGVKSLK
jgi:transketolase